MINEREKEREGGTKRKTRDRSMKKISAQVEKTILKNNFCNEFLIAF